MENVSNPESRGVEATGGWGRHSVEAYWRAQGQCGLRVCGLQSCCTGLERPCVQEPGALEEIDR